MAEQNNHQDFLRIMRLVFDTAPAVLAAYIDSKVYMNYKSFKSFLEKIKHSLYHKCKSQVYCCKCPDENQNFCFPTKDRHNVVHVFHQLFRTDKALLNKSHLNKKGTLKKVCICEFTPTDKSTSDFDIEVLGLLLTESGLLEDYQKKWLCTMKHKRNELCHLPGTTVLTFKQYQNIWKELETVIKDFARDVGPGIHFLRSIEREIDYLKTINFTEEQITSSLQKMMDAMEKTSHTVEEHGNSIKQIRDRLSSIDTQQINDKVEKQENIIKQLQEGLNLLLLERHRNVVATATVKSMDAESEVVDMKCKVHVPEAWNEHAIVEKMAGSSKVKMTENDLFCIMSSDEGCILLRIAIKKKAFEDVEALHFVIRSLLQTITNAADIDANVPAFVSFSLELYTEQNRERSHDTTGNHENRVTQTEEVDDKEEALEESENTNHSCSHSPPKQLVDNQDAPLESSTIGILTQMVLDVFPDIIREWILTHTTEEHLSESVSGDFVCGKVYTSLDECNFPTLLEVAGKCKENNIPILKSDKYNQTFPTDSDISPADDIIRMEKVYDRIIVTGSSVIREEEKDKILHEVKEILKRFDDFFKKNHFETYEGRFLHLCKYWGFSQDMYSVLDKFGLSFLNPQPETTVAFANIPRKQYTGLYDISIMQSTDSGHFSDESGRKQPYNEDRKKIMKRLSKRRLMLKANEETGGSETSFE